MTKTSSTLFLYPCPIADDSPWQMSPEMQSSFNQVSLLLCERARTTRRWLKPLLDDAVFQKLDFLEWDKHGRQDYSEIFEAWKVGQSTGFVSEAGLPCIADPGYELVGHAHKRDVKVRPFVGPSSIFLALMASGLSGQKFSFHGYLPRDKKELEHSLRQLESESRKRKTTQIFMETPYRNEKMIDSIIQALNPGTQLTIAQGIQSEEERIYTCTVKHWTVMRSGFANKVPTIFIIKA